MTAKEGSTAFPSSRWIIIYCYRTSLWFTRVHKFTWIISDVAHLQERIDTLESQNNSSSAKELQLQAELSAALSEVKQFRGAVSDADMYNKRCQELQSKLNG